MLSVALKESLPAMIGFLSLVSQNFKAQKDLEF